MDLDKATQVLGQVTDLFLQSSTSLPIVTGAVVAIGAIIKGITGAGPSPRDSIAVVKHRVATNRAFGDAEVQRLDDLLAQQQASEGL